MVNSSFAFWNFFGIPPAPAPPPQIFSVASGIESLGAESAVLEGRPQHQVKRAQSFPELIAYGARSVKLAPRETKNHKPGSLPGGTS